VRRAKVLQFTLALVILLPGPLTLGSQGPVNAATGSITGIVTDFNGAVVVCAKVTITNSQTGKHYETATDQNGLYQLPYLVVGRYTLEFAARGFETETRSDVVVNASKVERLDVRLPVGKNSLVCGPVDCGPIGCGVHGRVADATGAGIGGAHVTVKNKVSYESVTDSQGLYRFSEIISGSYDIRFEAPGFRTETRSAIFINASERMALDATLQVGTCCSGPQITITGSLEGRVADFTGAAVFNTRVVAANDSTGTSFTTSTDARGFYQFAQLDPGSYTVRFEARGFKTAVRKSVSVVAPGSTNLNVALTIGDTGGGGVEIKK
jgi:Carboxypeptidase regulatory-like domain